MIKLFSLSRRATRIMKGMFCTVLMFCAMAMRYAMLVAFVFLFSTGAFAQGAIDVNAGQGALESMTETVWGYLEYVKLLLYAAGGVYILISSWSVFSDFANAEQDAKKKAALQLAALLALIGICEFGPVFLGYAGGN